MNDKNYTGLIPENKKGKEITAEHSTTFGSDKDAKSFYKIARERLLNVNNWGKVTDNLAAIFQLTDEKGNEVKTTNFRWKHSAFLFRKFYKHIYNYKGREESNSFYF